MEMCRAHGLVHFGLHRRAKSLGIQVGSRRNVMKSKTTCARIKKLKAKTFKSHKMKTGSQIFPEPKCLEVT